MNAKWLTVLVAAALIPVAARAEFEGTIELKTTMTGADGGSLGGGAMKYAVSEAGIRTETKTQVQGMIIQVVMLLRAAEPDKLYRIDDQRKTYAVVEIPSVPQAAPEPGTTPFMIKKLGREKIQGYDTEHVVASQGMIAMELWVTKELVDARLISRMQAQRGPGKGSEPNLFKALKDAGVEGMPIKSVVALPGGGKQTMELVKAEKKPLPASLFEIPAGYTEAGAHPMSGVSAPAADSMRRAQDAMKNMSPEQRQMMEKMMKQRQPSGGSAP